jgi:hypothetical protein
VTGVGNKDDLQQLGIKSVLDQPEVGQNLQDHVPGSFSGRVVNLKINPKMFGLLNFQNL